VIPVAGHGQGTGPSPEASENMMQHPSRISVDTLRSFHGRTVLVQLGNHAQFVGKLRTELLTEKSISVYITRSDGSGATIYIDEIASLSDI
jgi:hypothetical protein